MRLTIYVHALTASIMALAPFMLSPARAEFIDGNDLYAKCTSASGQEMGFCLGYVVSVYDSLPFDAVLRVRKDCVGDITAGQLRDVVLKFLREKPAERNVEAAVLVRFAIMDAWPGCTSVDQSPS